MKGLFLSGCAGTKLYLLTKAVVMGAEGEV